MNAGGGGVQTSAKDESAAADTLDELAREPERIRELTHNQAAALLARLAALSLAVSSRVVTTIAEASNDAGGAPTADRLIGIKEAAKIIGMSATTLYRNKERYPFFCRNGFQIRFSANGIAKWITKRAVARTLSPGEKMLQYERDKRNR